MKISIPLSRPSFDDQEERVVLETLRSARVAGNGARCKELEEAAASQLGVRHAFAVPSCTAALEMSLLCLGIGPGDEVICPSFGFVSVPNAVLQVGAKPIFCDIDLSSLNMDVEHAETLVTPRTRAIIPVHYGGMCCDMDALSELAGAKDIQIIEDAAQALGSTFDGRSLGSLGALGCFSFHETKNTTCGEGGLLVTSDDGIAERAETIREKGTNRNAFLRGEVDKYTWVSKGSSYVLSDILAAVASVQLSKLPEFNKRRTEIAELYAAKLEGVRDEIELLRVHPKCSPNWHVFGIRTRPEIRDAVIEFLRSRGIGATFHFVPLHSSPYAIEYLGGGDQVLPRTDMAAATLIRLPIYCGLTDADVECVSDALIEALSSCK